MLGNAWGFSCCGAALLCSSAFHYIPLWALHHYHPPLHLSYECELLPSDSSLPGNASSCLHPAFAAGGGLAGLWHRAGVRSWDVLTWGLTGLLLCIGRRAVLGWLLTAAPLCCGGDHSLTGPQNSWGWQGSLGWQGPWPSPTPLLQEHHWGSVAQVRCEWAGFNCRESLHYTVCKLCN